MKNKTGILYLRPSDSNPPQKLPTDGEIERLIEETYPGVLASLILKEITAP